MNKGERNAPISRRKVTDMRNRINKTTFEVLRERFGWCASWAYWSPAGATPKSGVSDLNPFQEELLDSTLQYLHADAIFVGLNFSRKPDQPRLANFHSGHRSSQDYKLRYALQGTPYWGAYLTDIIKGYVEVASPKLMSALRNDPDLERSNVRTFLEELELLGSKDPLIVAMGADTHKILNRNLGTEFRILCIPHYAIYTSLENYRERVLEVLGKESPRS